MFHFELLVLTPILCSTPPLPMQPFQGGQRESAEEHKGRAVVSVRTDVGWVGSSQLFHIIVQITPDSGWHVYWKNPGASGAPTEIEVNAPKGYIVGEPHFPRPLTFHGEEGQTYGYNKSAAIFIPVTAPETVHDGQVTFEVTTSWLSCKKSCVMGEQENTLDISTNFLHQGPPHKDMQLTRWIDALPKPLVDLERGTSVILGNTLYVTGETELRPIQFIGMERKGIRFDTPRQPVFQDGYFRIPIPIYIDYSAIEGDEGIVEGLILFGRKSDDPSYVVQLTLDPTQNQHEGKGN